MKPTIEELAGSISGYSALVIQGNDVEIAVGKFNGKYAFELYRFERENFRPIITTNHWYDSEADARNAAEKVVGIIKSLDLTDKLPEFLRDDYEPPK